MKATFNPFFTAAGKTSLLYNAPEAVEITVKLETAGDVTIGTDSDLSPNSFNKGYRLDTGLQLTFRVGAGTEIYIASNTVDRVSYSITPLKDIFQPLIDGIKNAILTVQAATKIQIQQGQVNPVNGNGSC